MAIIYRAYTFSPVVLFQDLVNNVVDAGRISEQLLFNKAKDVVDNSIMPSREVLELARFDEDWLNYLDKDVSRSHLWFLLVLISKLNPIPDIDTRTKHHIVLPRLMPLLGWSQPQIELLIRGRPLNSLIETSGNNLFINEFVPGINAYGGWLDTETAAQLLVELQISTNSISTLEMTDRIQKETSLSPDFYSETALHNALVEIARILQISVARREALFIIID